MEDKLIISLTSYPHRINKVAYVVKSLLEQDTDDRDYAIVLVLAEPEFPNKERDLPDDLVELVNGNDNVGILWYPMNILSHKKLMPVLQKYPNHPILVCDDDVIRPQGWVKMFMNDHLEHPTDIIAGTFMYYYDEKLWEHRIKSNSYFGNDFMCNDKPGIIVMNARPANGYGGTLYPVGTFTDKRFFDEERMMAICPTSDESWQFAFNIMEGRVIRQSSVVYNYSDYFVEGTQDKGCLSWRNSYVRIFKRLYREFPEFKELFRKRIQEFNAGEYESID